MNYFEYPTPFLVELKEIYQVPYRFSKEIRDYINYIFVHPRQNHRHHKLYANLHQEYDSNDMAKPVYLLVKYFIDNEQQFAYNMENIKDQAIVSMWKTFIGIHKHLRGQQFNKYYTAPMKLSMDKLFELMIDEITNNKMIMHGDDMVKKRVGKTLRERSPASMKEGGKEFEYLCTLE